MIERLFYMNTRKAGKDYEEAAEDYLKSKGYRTLEKNYHCRYGEIDLIVRSEEGAVVFVEVKGRSKGNWGDPAEAVTPLKQKKILRTARDYIYKSRLSTETEYRFDVITFSQGRMEHIENAFY